MFWGLSFRPFIPIPSGQDLASVQFVCTGGVEGSRSLVVSWPGQPLGYTTEPYLCARLLSAPKCTQDIFRDLFTSLVASNPFHICQEETGGVQVALPPLHHPGDTFLDQRRVEVTTEKNKS